MTVKPDPRPVAATYCPECWAEPGGRHEWSCPEVPADLFKTHVLKDRSTPPTREGTHHDRD